MEPLTTQNSKGLELEGEAIKEVVGGLEERAFLEPWGPRGTIAFEDRGVQSSWGLLRGCAMHEAVGV